jgi:hypothetical protein
MSKPNEHVVKLRAALVEQVKARRELAEALAAPYNRGHTENMRDAFVKVQATIEAIERAMKHEMDATTSAPAAAGYKIDLDDR